MSAKLIDNMEASEPTSARSGTSSNSGGSGSSRRTKPEMAIALDFHDVNTIPKRVVKEGTTNEFRKLEPGEINPDSSIYGVLETPMGELGDFGLGIGLYFNTLAASTILFIVLGLINAWTIHYFRDGGYTTDGQEGITDETMYGSAICTDTQQVCKDNACNDTIEINLCVFDFGQAVVDFIVIFAVAAFILIIGMVQDKVAEKIDESEQTAQDYSVIVNDPDADATDPDEWRDFFSKFGQVAYITVAKNNGQLMELLARRRILIQQFDFECDTDEMYQAATSVQDTGYAFPPVAPWKLFLQSRGFMPDVACNHRQFIQLTNQINELKTKKYEAVKVFVIFETEQAQRSCLERLCVGEIPAALETSINIPEEYRFRSTNVLSVSEPSEPTDVFWHFLEYNVFHQLKEQSLNLFITGVLIVGVAFAIDALSKASSALTAIFISLANGILPVLCKILTATEEHHNSTSYQKSLLTKLVLSRWITTAVIIYVTAPFRTILTEAFIANIMSILWADAFTTPIIRLVDLPGRLGRFLLAPMSKTQAKMNSYFLGGDWFLAERYTDMTKTMFISLFYGAILPQGYFVSAVAFFVCYWVDKYCLLRLWKTPPAVDDRLTRASRAHMAFALFAHIVMTKYFFAQFPFNEYCDTGLFSTVTGRPIYTKCDQETSTFWITPTSSEWMNGDQKDAVRAYNVLIIVFFCLIFLFGFGEDVTISIRSLFYGRVRTVGEAQDIKYSTVTGIQAYVPQLVWPKLPFPLLACDLSLFNPEQISWTGNFEANNVCSENDLPGTTYVVLIV